MIYLTGFISEIFGELEIDSCHRGKRTAILAQVIGRRRLE